MDNDRAGFKAGAGAVPPMDLPPPAMELGEAGTLAGQGQGEGQLRVAIVAGECRVSFRVSCPFSRAPARVLARN